MNKIDLFQDKILHSERHLRLYLPQFKGRTDAHVDLQDTSNAAASVKQLSNLIIRTHFICIALFKTQLQSDLQ